jgi:hypothetical protein
MKYLDIYLNHLGRPLKFKLWLFAVVGLYFGAKAVWRVDQIDLPFHYILAVIPGVLMSLGLERMERTDLTRINQRVAQRLNPLSISLLLTWLFLMLNWLPGLLAYLLQFPNEALELTCSALLFGRIAITWRAVEHFLFGENRRHSLHLVPSRQRLV